MALPHDLRLDGLALVGNVMENFEYLDAREPSDGSGGAGTNGTNGWTPVLANVSDGARRVQRVTDWTGGTGTKPASGKYIGATGYVTDIADATDFRGAQGIQGAPGADGGGGGAADGPQGANLVKAGPQSGAASAPTYRTLVGADLPTATTLAKGAVQFAANGNATAGHVVGADDARLSDARPPNAHTQAIGTITDLQDELDAKTETIFVETEADIPANLAPGTVVVVRNSTAPVVELGDAAYLDAGVAGGVALYNDARFETGGNGNGNGGGDMLASDYDSDGDGKVDAAVNADNVPWAGVGGKPASFAPSAHAASHAVGESDAITITSAQISDLAAQIDAALAAVVDGAPGALDTLAEIAAKLGADDDALAALTSAINDRLTVTQANALYRRLDPALVANDISDATALGKSLIKAADAAAARTALNVDTHTQTEKTDAVDADEFSMWDSVSSAFRKITFANIAKQFVKKSLVTTKGDILVATASGALARLAAGAVGETLTPDATAATGVKWANVASGGGSVLVAPAGARILYPFDPAPVTGQVSTVAIPSAGAVMFLKIMVRERRVIPQIASVPASGFSASETAAFGLYDFNLNRLFSTGAVPMSAGTASGKIMDLAPPYTLEPGAYILAWTCSNPTVKFGGYGMGTYYQNVGPGEYLGIATNAAVAGDLPASLGALGHGSGSYQFPIVAFMAG